MRHLTLPLFIALSAFAQVPKGGGSAGGSAVGPENQSASFTAATSVAITHNLNTLNIIVKCYTSAGADIPVTSLSGQTVNAVTVGFASSTGRCVVNGTGGVGASGATGPAGADGAPGADGADASGTVESVSFTGGIISITNPTTTPALTVAGTSGGIPYFNSNSTWAGSGVLTANSPVIGGGAGASPAVGTKSGNTTTFVTTTGTQTSGKCVEIDANGNHVAAADACGTGTGSLPTQTSNANKALMTDGTNASWNRFVKNLAVSSDLSLSCSNGADITSGECTISVGGNVALLDANNAFEGITSFPASSAQTIDATSDVIVCNATRVAITAATTYTLSGVATIADPVLDGQVCIIQNVGSNAITLTDGSTQNLKLGASTVAISAGQSLTLIWDTTTGLWTQQVSAGGVSSGGMTNICSGGSTTSYTTSAEPSAGVAPSFSCTIPANTFSATGKTVECLINNLQTSTDGTHAGILNIRTYLNGTTLVTATDNAGTWASGMSVFRIQLMANGSVIGRVTHESTSAMFAAATGTPTYTSDITLEFRPWMTSIGDDAFSIQSYACWVRP